MSRQLRILLVLLGAIALLPALVWADAWDPPPTYYDGATATDQTLKDQLDMIIANDADLQTYGAARYFLDDTDEDPNNTANVLLFYSRTSVSEIWVPQSNAFGTREHVWPTSRRPDSAPDNGDTGIGSDLHMLKPLDNSTNISRGNKAFGDTTATGSNHSVSTDYYYPGDADSGDAARIIFYGGTRWKDEGLKVVNGPGVEINNEMGDLASLLVWNYLDPPDDFERRRNQLIYGYQNNRNPFIDHPEYVWAVYGDDGLGHWIPNDSQITIVGGSTDGSGGSTRGVDLGRVFVGGAVPAAQNFTLNKGGDNGTYYEVTAAGDATSSIAGRFNAFRTNTTDSRSITVGLDTTTATAGLRSGTVTVDNLDVTTDYGLGHGAQDGNDLFNVSLDVLDHAAGSFNGSTQVTSLMYDFGSVNMGAADPTFDFDLFNLESTVGHTAALDFDSLMTSGDTGVLAADLAAAAGTLSLDAGTSQGFTVTFDTASVGMFSATYTLMVSDEDLTGELTDSLALTVMGEIVAAGLPGDYNGNNVVDAADYAVWRDAFEANETELLNDESPGTVTEADFTYWRDHFGQTLGSGSGATGSASASAAVPEPASLVLLLLGGTALLLAVRRGGIRAS